MAEVNEETKSAAVEEPEPDPNLVDILSDGTKIKQCIPRQRVCTEKNAKGKLCTGKLKRWYGFGDEVKRKYGEKAEIYRCATCRTLYLPNPDAPYGTGTLTW